MTSPTFQAGVGRAIITPPLTAPHANWGAQTHVLAEGIDLDLLATVLVVSDGAETAAFCELEVVVISRPESDAIRAAVAAELGISPEQVRCSISHNHAGPPPRSWSWTTQGADDLEAYYTILPSLVASAAREAKLNLAPARMGWGRGESHVAVNRRETAPNGRTITGVNPEGASDPEVLVVRIDDEEGDPIAAIVGYTMHPTFLGPTNRLLSSDWPGHMRRIFEQATGAACLFAQGATGDVGPGPKGFSDDLKAVHSIGAQVGCEAARVWHSLDIPTVRYEHERIWESGASLGKWRAVPIATPEPVVRTRSLVLDLPLRPQVPRADAIAQAEAAKQRLEELKASGAPAAEVEAATFTAKRSSMTRNRSEVYDGLTSTPVGLHLLQIGPVVFAGFEGEPFLATGKQIKAASPFPATWFGGYTGGWAGYIPTPEEFPRAGYEVDISPFADTAAGVVAEGTIAALNDLYGSEDR